MLKNESKFEKIIPDKGKNKQNKSKCTEIILGINVLLLLIIGIFGYFLIANLKKDVENLQLDMNKNNHILFRNSKKLKEFEDKNFVENTLFTAQIDELKIQIQNNVLIEQPFKNISMKLKEIEEDNSSLRKQINEINIESNELKKQILENISIDLKEIIN